MEAKDEDEMYEPLLDNIDVDTLMEEDDLEIEKGSRDELRGMQQEHFARRDQGPLEKRRRTNTRSTSEP